MRLIAIAILALTVSIALQGVAWASGALDGRIFEGVIGPVDNPDLPDSLHFSDGHFWSDICTKCGFMPGKYETSVTDSGIQFRGTLESESRGRFNYDGLVKEDGSMTVSIQWERRRWYWTTRREIVFRGDEQVTDRSPILSQIRLEMEKMDPSSNPLCARF